MLYTLLPSLVDPALMMQGAEPIHAYISGKNLLILLPGPEDMLKDIAQGSEYVKGNVQA